jgi:hypothetical protein
MAQAELANLAIADACRGKAEHPVVVQGNHDPRVSVSCSSENSRGEHREKVMAVKDLGTVPLDQASNVSERRR